MYIINEKMICVKQENTPFIVIYMNNLSGIQALQVLHIIAIKTRLSAWLQTVGLVISAQTLQFTH